eukprot:1160018-Pelagomonas_calceolata.AAC.11
MLAAGASLKRVLPSLTTKATKIIHRAKCVRCGLPDVTIVYGGHKHKNTGVKCGPMVELWAILGRSEARRVI